LKDLFVKINLLSLSTTPFVSTPFCAVRKTKNALLLTNHFVKIHKTNHANSKIGKKLEELMCFQQCPPSITCLSFFSEFEQQE